MTLLCQREKPHSETITNLCAWLDSILSRQGVVVSMPRKKESKKEVDTKWATVVDVYLRKFEGDAIVQHANCKFFIGIQRPPRRLPFFVF
jgi:hypothetical protein